MPVKMVQCSSMAFFQEADPLGSGRSPTDNVAGPSSLLTHGSVR